MKWRATHPLVCVTALAVVLGGCGGGDSGSDTATTTTTPTPTSVRDLPDAQQIEELGNAWAPLLAAQDKAMCEYLSLTAGTGGGCALYTSKQLARNVPRDKGVVRRRDG